MMHGDSYPSVPSPAVFADTIVENMSANPCASWLGSANHEVWNVNQEVQEQVDESFFFFETIYYPGQHRVQDRSRDHIGPWSP